MAVWGGWVYTGGNGLRVGADYAGDPVDTNTGTYHVHIWYYVNTQYNYSGDVQALNFAGWIGGSQGYTLSAGHNAVVLVAERDLYFNYGNWGSSPGNMQVNAQVSGAYNGSNPSLFLDFPIPARPYAPPAAPGALNAWMDAGGTSASLTWTGNQTAQAPYSSVVIQHNEYGPAGWTGWYEQVTVGTGGGPASFVWQGLAANRIHAFQMVATNPVGISGWVSFPWVYFTPAAPINVHSALGPTGTSIVTTWVPQHYSDGSQTLTIERSVGGGAWVQVVAGLAWDVATWTDPTPGGGANQYRVKVISAGLSSAWALSNVVSTVVPPLAPTQLNPDGQAVDVQFVGAVLTWLHNPGGDFAAQSHYSIETSANGGALWTALVTNVASAVSSHTLAAGVLTNGATYLWRVKTQGGTTAAFGPFSAGATIVAETTPVISLDPAHPADPTVQLPLDVSWFYTQVQGVPQAGWEAVLYAADGTTILEQQAGDGTGNVVTFAWPVLDGDTYVVRVRARSGSGMWSVWVSKTTTIDLPPPADITITTLYDECAATMGITLVPQNPGVGEVPVSTMVVERRVPGGTWVTLVRDLVGPVTFLDPIPTTNGVNEYRVTGFSSAPSYRVSPVVNGVGTDGQPGSGLWVSIAWGAGFHSLLRVHGDVTVEDAPSRVGKAQPFLGRPKPVLLAGANTTRKLSVSGELRYNTPSGCPPGVVCPDTAPAVWVTAATEAEIVCYRDYTGRRLFGMLDGVSVGEGVWPGHAGVSFTVTEVDYAEMTGVVGP